jgi:hypothetical protein
MGKRAMGHRALYILMLLSLCLGSLVAHILTGGVGNIEAYNSLHMTEYGESHDHGDPHDHEDDLTLLTTAASGSSPCLTMRATANHSLDSRAVLPLLPPPKAA